MLSSCLFEYKTISMHPFHVLRRITRFRIFASHIPITILL
uniref:Uncharacterized protein n=1 Tax=Parascaris univalens TaxID=6257 RepID=A0A914ZFW6_PARUN